MYLSLDVFDGRLQCLVHFNLLLYGTAGVQYGRVVFRTYLLADSCQREVGQMLVGEVHGNLACKYDVSLA